MGGPYCHRAGSDADSVDEAPGLRARVSSLEQLHETGGMEGIAEGGSSAEAASASTSATATPVSRGSAQARLPGLPSRVGAAV